MATLKNWLKTRLRSGLGLPALEKQIQQIKNSTERMLALQEQTQQSKNDLGEGKSTIELEYPPQSHSNNYQQMHALIMELINSSKPGSVFSCQINGIDLLAPVELLRLYPHCNHPSSEKKLTYFIETQQSDWLCSKLKPGDVALDIGAAYGVITLALSRAVGEQGAVHSFEPSKTTQKFLHKLLELNELRNVTIVKSAISDTCDSIDFIEYTSENELSWASDTSSLASETLNLNLKHLRYSVDVTTIDDYVAARGIHPKAIKIDIEGFELYALHGAKKTLKEFSPYLCIDIHKDVRTGESALLEVQPYLLELGYHIHIEGHALYAQK